MIKVTNDQPTIITNGFLRNLTLKILTDLKDNYDSFTQLVLLSKSIGSFHLDLANHEFISDSPLLKYFSYTSMLYKLSLSNIKFSNKNSYIYFATAIA